MKKVLVSFADRYQISLDQLKKSTEDFGFDDRYFLTEKALPVNVLTSLNPEVYRRGFGYWRWKPYVVKQCLDKLSGGDILVYSDGGVYWDIKGIKRFQEYLSMLDNNQSILCFQRPFLEKDWTKGDVLEYFKAYDDDNITMSLQLWGGCFIVRKNKTTERLISEWYDICMHHADLFTDKKSKKPNLNGFREHRHDQSVLSVMVKRIPHREISWKEVEGLAPMWYNIFPDFPIQGRRLKISRPPKRIIWRFTKWKSIAIGWYLKHYKDFYFANNRLEW